MSGQSQDTRHRRNPSWTNPLAQPLPKWYEFYKRIRLFPWWVKYNSGFAEEAILRNKIIELGRTIGFQDKWMQSVIQHAVSEFSKKGLGTDYYGYHNLNHELEATYISLLAACGESTKGQWSTPLTKEDLKYLFMAALFHDYDPLKRSDKPHEDAVEWFIRNDPKIIKFIDDFGINLEIVIAMIYRTVYPFKGELADLAKSKMQELFTRAGITLSDSKSRKHYEDLGWFLSISERIAGYALSNFERARELARRHAHALGWHPALINEESVNFFSMLKEEKGMFERVITSIPEEYKQNFFDNVAAFRELWDREVEIRSALRKGRINLESVLEKVGGLESHVRDTIIAIYKEFFVPIRMNNEKEFIESISYKDTIIVTLRVKEHDKRIVGYVKGGALERYTLRHGTLDENFGKNNTTFMEWISIRPGYWGQGGGHLLRRKFLNEAARRGYKFLTSYVHRDVLMRRINTGQIIEIVQKYDPDKLDYYRIDLENQILFKDKHNVASPQGAMKLGGKTT